MNILNVELAISLWFNGEEYKSVAERGLIQKKKLLFDHNTDTTIRKVCITWVYMHTYHIIWLRQCWMVKYSDTHAHTLYLLFKHNEINKQRPMHKSNKHHFSVVGNLCMYA